MADIQHVMLQNMIQPMKWCISTVTKVSFPSEKDMIWWSVIWREYSNQAGEWQISNISHVIIWHK